jgi:hypothetical protein
VRVSRTLFGKHRWFDANVDAFADGELRGLDLSCFEAHLDGCDRCRATVRKAQGMKSLVAALPELPATRSFAITEAMLNRPRAVQVDRAGGFFAPLRAVQGFGAAAVALFAVLVVVDVGGGGSGSLASRDGDFDAPVHEDLESTSEFVPAAATPIAGGSAELADDDDVDSEDGGVQGAGVEPPQPLPTPGSDSLFDDEDTSSDDAGRAVDDQLGYDDETTAALVRTEADDGGLDWLRLGQFASALGAVGAALAYFGIRGRNTA